MIESKNNNNNKTQTQRTETEKNNNNNNNEQQQQQPTTTTTTDNNNNNNYNNNSNNQQHNNQQKQKRITTTTTRHVQLTRGLPASPSPTPHLLAVSTVTIIATIIIHTYIGTLIWLGYHSGSHAQLTDSPMSKLRLICVIVNVMIPFLPKIMCTYLPTKTEAYNSSEYEDKYLSS